MVIGWFLAMFIHFIWRGYSIWPSSLDIFATSLM